MPVIILKVGTSVVTDVNGQLDTDRIAGMVTEMSVLIKDGYRFILITSGAVACGRAVLTEYSDSGASNNLNLDENLRLRMSAAIGQPILFQEYQRNLSDKNVVSAQVLVTDIDFQDPDRRRSIEQALLNMLERGIVPIINENDAITTRTTKYRDGQGKILWDNDSLAGLIGRSVLSNLPPNASIQLCLASNIDGVYNTKSQVIPTWTQLSLKTVTNNLATTSSYGRGGITAKITAATGCANYGITTVIFNGMVTDNISKVVRGDSSVGIWFYPPTINPADDTGRATQIRLSAKPK
jgi:delta-1-pyrroline-5-carboxylate synthetase